MSLKWKAPGRTGILFELMTKISRRQSLFVMAWGAMLSPLMGRAVAQGLVSFKKEKLAIISQSGRHEFDVELALSDRQQAQGLMFRRSLPASAGMLFDYRVPTRINMWMKNTFIPLDMIFIGTDRRITNIARRTVPMSETTISSKGRVRAVLEVNSGTAARLGIKPGDKIVSATLGR